MSVVEAHSVDSEISQTADSPGADARPSRLRRLAGRAASLPVLVVAFVVVTVLASGPLRELDKLLDFQWIRWYAPSLRPFFQEVLDRIAGQAVVLPVLAAVAIPLAWRRRSWRPILAGFAAEVGFLGVIGLMKIGFARPAPQLNDPSFFQGGLFSQGWHGISYPSGHAAESVIFYGLAVCLIAKYSSASRRLVTLLGFCAALITLNAVFTSFVLGWHWVTDLVGGVVAGGVVLRIIVRAEAALPDRFLPVGRPLLPVSRAREVRAARQLPVAASWVSRRTHGGDVTEADSPRARLRH
ncbi:MAG: phosphatase PAP2 family protein [Streptosporangiales bacterium]|nr:phosphatase PAP2 family protein [Streptosporangiales bacterium]